MKLMNGDVSDVLFSVFIAMRVLYVTYTYQVCMIYGSRGFVSCHSIRAFFVVIQNHMFE